MSFPISTAIIGLGRIGWLGHFKTLNDHPAFRIRAVADPLEQRRNEAVEASGCEAFPDLDTLLDNCDAELVIVATPTTFHEEDAAKVFAAGRHCILEKPMALDYAGARRVTALATKSGKRLFVHHQHRFMSELPFLEGVIARGILGRPVSLHMNWANYKLRNDWQTLRRNGGGLLNNHGPHAFTVLLPLLGSPIVELTSSLQQAKDAGDCEDHVDAFIRTEAGMTVHLTLTTVCACPLPRYVLMGQYGSVIMEADQPARLRYFDPSVIGPLEVVDGANAGRSYKFVEDPPWVEEEVDIHASRPSLSFHDNVAAVLRQDGECIVTPEHALEVMRLIEWTRTGVDPADSA